MTVLPARGRFVLTDADLLRLAVIGLGVVNWAVLAPFAGGRDHGLAPFLPLIASVLVLPAWLRTRVEDRRRKLYLFGAVVGLTVLGDAVLLATLR